MNNGKTEEHLNKIPNHLSVLIKPSSSMCNLRCSYCFYADISESRSIKNYGFLSKLSSKILIEKSFEFVSSSGTVVFAFQGGEPTLAGLEFFRFFVDEVNQVKSNQKVKYVIQTNGTLINQDWAKFFKQNDFLVGVSVDGFMENHDYFRYDAHCMGQYQKTIDGINRLREEAVDFNILTVLTSRLSKYPVELYNFYKQEGFDNVQLIPCLPSLDRAKETQGLTPLEFSSFYTRFFDLWLSDTNRFSVGLFNDIISMFRGEAPITCGMLGRCNLQFVIEGDGSVFPCDFYVIDQYKIGNILTDSFEQLITSDQSTKFLNEPKRFSSKCFSCPFLNMCNSNCKRMNIVYFDEKDCGYQILLNHMFKALSSKPTQN